MTLDREWEKLRRSLDLQEEQFKNKILPRNRFWNKIKNFVDENKQTKENALFEVNFN